jgi:hypothetical protein
MRRKMLLFFILVLAAGMLAACQGKGGKSSGELIAWSQSAAEVAKWTSMVTPGGGEGTVEAGDNVAIIKAAADGWGGVQSQKITIDFSKNPMLFVRVKENADGFKWGAKFVPSNPEIDDHAWGVYLIEDNNFKWNNYGAVDMRAKVGEDFISMYGEKIEGVIWIYAAGSPEAVVEVSEVKIMNGNAMEGKFSFAQSAADIAKWTSMVTPGGGEGTVETGDNVAIIKAAADGWGGVQSQKITVDFSKDPMLLVRVKENADGFKWGAKFVPANLEIEDHAWGVYLIEDNNFKWNNYGAVNMRDKVGEDFISMYGEKIEGVLWIYAAGSPEAVVEVTEVKILEQK